MAVIFDITGDPHRTEREQRAHRRAREREERHRRMQGEPQGDGQQAFPGPGLQQQGGSTGLLGASTQQPTNPGGNVPVTFGEQPQHDHYEQQGLNLNGVSTIQQQPGLNGASTIQIPDEAFYNSAAAGGSAFMVPIQHGRHGNAGQNQEAQGGGQGGHNKLR